MEIPDKIGWKRLLLTRSQKYLLDISRLGSNKEPDRVEKFIMFLEEWTPSMLVFRAKKYGFKALLRMYWALTPVRLHVVSARKPWIEESLPWFPDGEYDRYVTVNNWNRKKLKIDSLRRDINSKKEYVYSWKKAYFLIDKVAEEVRQRVVKIMTIPIESKVRFIHLDWIKDDNLPDIRVFDKFYQGCSSLFI